MLSPIPAPLSERMGAQFQTAIEERQCVFLHRRSILQPVRDDGQMKQGKSISTEIAQIGDFTLCGGSGQNVAYEPQVMKVLLLSRKAQGAEAGGGLERA